MLSWEAIGRTLSRSSSREAAAGGGEADGEAVGSPPKRAMRAIGRKLRRVISGLTDSAMAVD